MMLKGETLQKILEVLREAEGYFVLRDEAGEEFVVLKRKDFTGAAGAQSIERQLSLPTASSLATAVRETAERMETTPAFVLDSINREVARYTEEQREKEIDDLGVAFDKNQDKEGATRPQPPERFGRPVNGKKVRFEPITGDLPPELQE